MKYLIERLKEPSTWRGLIMVATGVAGANWGPESQETIVYVGVSLAGIVGAILPDRWNK